MIKNLYQLNLNNEITKLDDIENYPSELNFCRKGGKKDLEPYLVYVDDTLYQINKNSYLQIQKPSDIEMVNICISENKTNCFKQKIGNKYGIYFECIKKKNNNEMPLNRIAINDYKKIVNQIRAIEISNE